MASCQMNLTEKTLQKVKECMCKECVLKVSRCVYSRCHGVYCIQGVKGVCKEGVFKVSMCVQGMCVALCVYS